MLFSVVIPTYNRVGLLPLTLRSVWEQSFTDFEVVVVDDGSTDGTLEYLQSLDLPIRVVVGLNKGPGAARNLGSREASGDYIAFLDSDDVWFPWTLEVFAQIIQKYGEPAIIGAKLVEFGHEDELAPIRAGEISEASFTDYFESSRHAYFVGAGMAVIRRDAVLRSGGFIEERVNAEDHDLILRLGTESGFIQVLAPTTLGWRRHAISETRDLRKSALGSLRLIEQERSGAYPGGAGRASQRREIVTRHARPAALNCLKCGALREGWLLYSETFNWHLKQKRWRFLAAFPWLTITSLLRFAKADNAPSSP